MAAPAPLRLALSLAVLHLLPTSLPAQAIQDGRCYLMSGGAVESFFVAEDTPVGSVIGTLSVNGDPDGERGDISLKLQEKDAAIGIAPGTKNITLLRALDREEKTGPSNVYVNVRCDRRRTTDPSFIIPVSIRVWDVNDNAPVWVGAPYVVRVSELTGVGARVPVAARATDADQPGPHATVHYSLLPGPHSEYFEFPNELDSTLVVKKPLDFETLPVLEVTLVAQDGGQPARSAHAALRVELRDADDQNPAFTSDHYSALLPDDAIEGTILETQPGPISAKDQDVGINAPVYYAATGDKKDLVLVDRDTGRIAVTKMLIEEKDFPMTVVIKATQVDNADRYALATVTVGRRAGALRAATPAGPAAAAPDAPAAPHPVSFSSGEYDALVPEDAVPGLVLTTLRTLPAHTEVPLQFFVSERSFLDKFAINSAGEVLLRRPLDYETQHSYRYQVMVTDGNTNDTASINITVINVNEWEPRFRYPQYEFRLSDAGSEEDRARKLLPVGKLEVFDGDKGDKITLTLRGSDASMLHINDMGELFMKQEALSTLNSTILHVVATAVDSGRPARQTSVPILVHVNEQLLSSHGEAHGISMVVVFAAALGLLALLVLALLVYICRVRRRSKSAASANVKTNFTTQEKPSPRAAVPAAGSGSLQSVSAGASTILADSSSSLDLRAAADPQNGASRSATVSRQSQRFQKSKIAPAPPSLETSAGSAGGADVAGGAGAMSDHLRARAGRSGVAWPSSTIPAKVKKLSWDDTDADTDTKDSGGGEGGAGRAVLEATNPAAAEHMNLTVYF